MPIKRLHERQEEIRRRNNPSFFKKYSKKIIYSSLVILLLTAFIFGDYFYDSYIYQPSDQRIVQINNLTGFTTEGRRNFYRLNPELNNYSELLENCDEEDKKHINLYGCFDTENNKIYLLNIESGPLVNNMYVFAAHEFLHSVYSNLSSKDKAIVNSELIKLWDNNQLDPEIRTRLIEVYEYEVGSDEFYDELHSIVGPESFAISDNLERHYSKYFIDRLAIAKLNTKTVREIDEIEASLDRQNNELIAMNNELTELGDFLNSLKRRMDYDYYNYPYRYNSNVDYYNSNVNKYNDLLIRVNNKRTAVIAAYDSYEGMFESLKNGIPETSNTFTQ